jgi:SAM-dependent methyltransferase
MPDTSVVRDAIRHYDELLAQHYSWMVGVPFETKTEQQKKLLEALGVTAGRHGRALDLGAGPGYQSAALADLGFTPVLAIDTSRALLAELSAQKGGRAIETLHGDLRHLSRYAQGESAETIVCMGDVLPHLERQEDVSRLLRDCFAILKQGGRLVLTFRDLSQELVGLDRFIPVQSDPDRVMVCVLEYEPRTVLVHDLIHTRNGSGWRLDKSCYRKLRLAPRDVTRELGDLGFEIAFDGPAAGMWAIGARKP